jgi:hypothetical protein
MFAGWEFQLRWKKKPKLVAPVVAARNGDTDRRPAHQEAALGLVVEHRDELGAMVGLAAQRVVRDDDRGSRHAVGAMRSSTSCGMVRRSSASLASSPLSIVTAVQRRPAPLRAIAVNTCVPIGKPPHGVGPSWPWPRECSGGRGHHRSSGATVPPKRRTNEEP